MRDTPLPEDARARLDVTIRGRVQGVGFRYFVRRRATALGIVGWVANQADGSVRCVAEGPSAALDELESALRSGPPGSHVERVDAVRGPAGGGFDSFLVRSGAHSGD